MENEIFLFPGKAPGSEKVHMEEIIFEEPWEHTYKRVIKGVTAPSLIPFIPEKPNGAAVIVIPGGAYRRQVFNLEGTDIAEWLNSFGVTAFVLKHRMPGDGHEQALDVPLQDGQRAVRLVRSMASQYGINPAKVGVMGFSAGGHLASALGTCYDRTIYEPIDSVDQISAKPDFLVLCYPCISLRGWNTNDGRDRSTPIMEVLKKYSTDELVTKDTPTSFIMVADDDTITPAEHSVNFYLALRKARVPAELHAYRAGQHGFGMGTTKGPVQSWTAACRSWLETVIEIA
ncbi:alpha/beta hydrolase [Paenibacillus sp. GD4]|uniref:alpha/beta hydrolase n=1 Tax=Paenibacillus sp. GD4 TaxID=3068890 RepID=UPI0027968F5A|nr:alpha/beta hydrolase [Paenibacillus sp. GD4]MDQ1913829.1 alpha/beta hydrolase [Paenibacillus sp. GD4]